MPFQLLLERHFSCHKKICKTILTLAAIHDTLYRKFHRACRGNAPPSAVADRAAAQKPHWGFHCSAALRKRGPTPNPAGNEYGKLEVVCYKISATNSSIKRFTCSGLSVLELCPAPSIHVKGIFVLRCHALLYRIHEPA